jgi:hypothetical protein
MATYTAVAPDGVTRTIKSSRVLTHAVAYYVPAKNEWSVPVFCGSRELAVKRMRMLVKRHLGEWEIVTLKVED